MQLFARKSVDQCIAESSSGGMKRTLGPVSLTAMGIGAIIGAGIFASIGTAIAGDVGHLGAGPAIVISLLIAGFTSTLAALCYAEMAAMIPISGSAYTYAYATLGEFIAWIIGWDLILEYAVGNIAVALGWGAYFDSLLRGMGITLPRWLVTDLRSALADPKLVASAPHLGPIPIIFNLPAFGIVALITLLLVVGIKESAWANNLMVGIKLLVVVFFIVIGVKFVRPEQWHTPSFAPNGWAGIGVGAAIIFFSYIGFDAVSTAAEEAKNPRRDMPIAILSSLVICTIIYVGIALVLTGIVPWNKLDVADPLALGLQYVHADWAAGIVAFGAVVATTSVLLVFQLGQPRIFFSMARDGLLWPWIAKLHPRFRTPHIATIITGAFVAFSAGFASIGWVLELTNIGTLFAFVLVAIGIVILRHREPDRARPFRTPWVPLVPILTVIMCIYLMAKLPMLTWLRFFLWLGIGGVIYFFYGSRHSRVRTGAPPPVQGNLPEV